MTAKELAIIDRVVRGNQWFISEEVRHAVAKLQNGTVSVAMYNEMLGRRDAERQRAQDLDETLRMTRRRLDEANERLEKVRALVEPKVH